MDCRARTHTVAACCTPSKNTEPLVFMADPPGGSIRHWLPACLGIIGQQTMPKLRVIPVRIKDRIGTIRRHQISCWHWLLQPSVIRMTSKLQYPARHHHRDPLSSELVYERVEPFPSKFACDKYAAARRSTSFSCSSSRLRFRSSFSSSFSDFVTSGCSPAAVRAWRIHLSKVPT